MAPFDHQTDVVIVGSGMAGLIAAIVVKNAGLEPLVLEKSDGVGGASAYSGGGVWIPNNPLQPGAGVRDSAKEARAYLDAVVGDVGPASSSARRQAFLREGPRMIEYLADCGFRWRLVRNYPDYYPDQYGASVGGRAVEAECFDAKELGPWRDKLRKHPSQPGLPLRAEEVNDFAIATRTLGSFATVLKVVAGRYLGRRLLGQEPVGLGRAVVGRLLKLAIERQVAIRLNTRMIDLVVDQGRVVGVTAESSGRRLSIGANHAVLLVAGGFARDAKMRQAFQEQPIGADWTAVPPEDTGDAVKAGMGIGAATGLMDDSWWIPSSPGHDGEMVYQLWERSLPHSLIVDGTGQRYMNESASYTDCGHWMYERNRSVPAIPSWLIFDARHRSRYPFGSMLPWYTPKSAFESGAFKRADSIEALAREIGLDQEQLRATVSRFNQFAASGIDGDFGRGGNVYDQYYGDPTHGPNPNLGTLERAPFYATPVYPGDIGTKGGLLTDEHARVLREDGSVIDGLYAAGNTTASVMGRTYPGPGSTLGPASTFAFIAARHIATSPSGQPAATITPAKCPGVTMPGASLGSSSAGAGSTTVQGLKRPDEARGCRHSG